MTPDVHSFFDKDTNTVTYIVMEPEGTEERHCVIIDPVLDYISAAGRTHTASADQVIAFVQENNLSVDWILETHPHADHVTAAPYLQQKLGGKVGIGEGICRVQENFKSLFNLPDSFPTDGSQFDHLFKDGEAFSIGAFSGKVIATPGHTPACVSYVIGDAVFLGDSLFMPDFGSARCDFPDGDARLLYSSVQKVLTMPPETRLFTCHDYAPGGRDFAWECTVGEQRAKNIHMNDTVDEEAFVEMRETRDKQLSMPNLILPAIQINIANGALPEPEDNGVSYLKIPINAV